MVMLTSYVALRTFLDAHLDEILSKLGKEFHSDAFIKTFSLIYPNEYADSLLFAKSYGLLHSWIVRCYLKKCDRVRDLGLDPKPRKAVLGSTTHNHRWAKR